MEVLGFIQYIFISFQVFINGFVCVFIVEGFKSDRRQKVGEVEEQGGGDVFVYSFVFFNNVQEWRTGERVCWGFRIGICVVLRFELQVEFWGGYGVIYYQ